MLDIPELAFIGDEDDIAEYHSQRVCDTFEATRPIILYIVNMSDDTANSEIDAGELAPVWDFLEALALARIFGIDKDLYEEVDRRIDTVGAASLILMSLMSFDIDSLGVYFDRPDSPKSMLLSYFRMLTTWNWMYDNAMVCDTRVDDVLEKLDRLKELLDRYKHLLRDSILIYPEAKELWEQVLEAADDDFITNDYLDITEPAEEYED